MSITASSLISDSCNLLKNRLNDFFILSLISAIIGLILYYIFVPIDEITTIIKNISEQHSTTNSILEIINKLSIKEKKTIIKISLLSLISILSGSILLFSSVLTYLLEINSGNNLNALQALKKSLYVLPNMFMLITTCTIIIYIGLMLFFLPGIFFMIGFSFSPIILITTKNTLIFYNILNKSWKIAFDYWSLILSILLIWLLLQTLVSLLIGLLIFLPLIIRNIIISTLNNLLTSFVLIYYFRLYILIKK